MSKFIPIDFRMFDSPDWFFWVVSELFPDLGNWDHATCRTECPMPYCAHRRKRAFVMNFDIARWSNFCCPGAGNALTLWMKMKGLNPYFAALDMCRKRGLPVPYFSFADDRGDDD